MVAINFLGDGLQAACKRSVAMRTPNLATMGFLAVAFAMVGLIGLVASYAAPLPLERALARDAALDAVLATGGDAAAIEALRPRLGESADALLPVGGDMAGRVAHERVAMHARLLAEADAIGTRLRWLICIVTVMGAAFGIALLGVKPRRG